VPPMPVEVVVPMCFIMVACHAGNSTATRLIHRSAWKGYSQKLNFRFTEFSEVR
jgi:hypothetical protein